MIAVVVLFIWIFFSPLCSQTISGVIIIPRTPDNIVFFLETFSFRDGIFIGVGKSVSKSILSSWPDEEKCFVVVNIKIPPETKIENNLKFEFKATARLFKKDDNGVYIFQFNGKAVSQKLFSTISIEGFLVLTRNPEGDLFNPFPTQFKIESFVFFK